MATYFEISSLPTVNDVNHDKVEALKKSILSNGWKGAPILYTNMGLVTGSHRLAALQEIEESGEDDDVYWDELDFGNLGEIFVGTWVEEYKDEIREW